MDCETFREQILSDLRNLSDAQHEHIRSCAMCHAFFREAKRVDRAFAKALLRPVPEGMAERVIAAVGTTFLKKLVKWIKRG